MRLFALIVLTLNLSAAELSPSILMFHEWDLNDCSNRLQKSLNYNSTNVHFLLAAQFVSLKNNEVEYYCFNNTNGNCEEISKELISRVYQKMKNCLRIVPKDVEISLTFHLNDATNKSLWRNNLIFDPIKKYKDYSYNDLFMTPTLKILRQLGKSAHVSIQGEMGATIFSHPESYLELINDLKFNYPNNSYGISLNYNKLDGGQFKKSKIKYLQSLIHSLDFLGFSAYAPLSSKVTKQSFIKYVNDFKEKLNKLNLTISNDLPLQFTEIGLGGGNWVNDGKTPARSVRQAANSPYSGLHEYHKKLNPWSKRSMRKFRRNYHKSLIKFLADQSEVESNPVSRAFIWSAGSWDIFGIYPRTEGFKDKKILKYFKNI